MVVEYYVVVSIYCMSRVYRYLWTMHKYTYYGIEYYVGSEYLCMSRVYRYLWTMHKYIIMV